jgi:hypothetical protein
MNRPGLLVFLGVMALISVVARGNEKPAAEYVEAMKTLNTIAEGLGKAVETYDFATIEKYVIAARPALDLVQKFWEAKKVEDAVQAAQDASAAIAELSVSATVRSDEGASVATKTLLDACARCHAAHREKLPDGTFAIK